VFLFTELCTSLEHNAPEKFASLTIIITWSSLLKGRHGGLIASALDPGSSGLGWSPGWGNCVVFLGKTFYFHCASLHLGV